MVSILRGAPDGEFVVWMGIKCSSWVSISQPSCGRSYLDPMGYETQNNILANAMVGRTELIILFHLNSGPKMEPLIPPWYLY